MSLKDSKTTSDYIPWDSAMMLIRRLYRNGDYRFSLLIGCGCFFGLRISDLLSLTWKMLLDDSKFEITEQKTKKRRVIKINMNFQKHIKKCFTALHIMDLNEKCFISNKKTVYSIQRINVRLKEIKASYGLKCVENFSSHSLRKTFGRHIFEQAGNNSEMALVLLSELFHHSNIAVTKKYLGLRKEELLHCYDLLDF